MHPEPLTSVIYPVQANDIGSVMPFARLLQRRGRGRLWLGQSLNIETHQVFAALAGMGLRVPFGSSVVLSPLRHPYEAALDARSVATLSGQPYVAGIGPGAPDFQHMMLEDGYAKPVSASREYVTIMRDLLDGKVVDTTGGHFTTRSGMVPMEHPPVEVGLGVLRPAMARAAGRAADVAITWLTPAAYVRDVLLPEMTAAAEAAGRAVPRTAVVVHAAVDRPGRDLTEAAYASAGAHLSADHYTGMLRDAGVPADSGDPRQGAELLVKSGVFASGTPEEIAEQLAGYHRSGVNEVIVNVCGVWRTEGHGAAMRDLGAILRAVDTVDGEEPRG